MGDKKPKKCATEFAALRKAYNDIVDEYVGLPQKLKKETVERVPLSFEDIDIGSTNLKDSKNVCGFAKKLVDRLKKAEDNHKKRLAAARKLVCSKAGELVKSKVISKLFTCLRTAKKAADAGSDKTAKDDANKDVTNFDNNGYKRVEKLLKLTAKKCLMKDTPKSKKARVAGLFRKTLKTKIKRQMRTKRKSPVKSVKRCSRNSARPKILRRPSHRMRTLGANSVLDAFLQVKLLFQRLMTWTFLQKFQIKLTCS